MTYATVSFENKETGAVLTGEYIADTGPTWLVKPSGKPVQVLSKAEWASVAAPSQGRFGDIIFDLFGYR